MTTSRKSVTVHVPQGPGTVSGGDTNGGGPTTPRGNRKDVKFQVQLKRVGGAGLIGGYGGNSSNTNSGSSRQQYCGNGGDGKLCTLNGISSLHPTQYWAGGGGDLPIK